MKRSILFFLMMLVVGACTSRKANDEDDEQDESIEPPSAVSSAFEDQYPGVEATWGKEDENFEANFKYDSKEMSAIYDNQGTLIETEIEIEISDLPSSIREYMNANYSGEKMAEAAMVTKANGDILYEAEIEGKDIVFDADGNFIKEEKE